MLNCTANVSSSDSSLEEVANSSCPEAVVVGVSKTPAPLPVPTSWDNYVPPAIFAVIFLVGMSGNSLVIYVVAFFRKMRTVTNYYLCNLAVTDMAFLLCCVPFTAAQYAMPSWVFGEHMCRMVNYMMQVTVQATCLTLAAVSVDRYCVIVHPVASLIFRRKRVAVAGSVIIWIVSFLMALPDLMHYRLVELNWEPYGWQTICRPVWPSKSYERGYMIYSVLSTYFIPFLICLISGVPIVYRLWHRFDNVTVPPSNVEKTKKSTLMVIGVVVLFTLCWLPNHVINLWWHSSSDKRLTAAVYYSKFVGVCLSYANSAMNPFVYAIVGDSFRDCIRQTFCRTKRQRRLAAGTRRACPKRAFPVHSRVSTRQLSRVSRTRSTGSTIVQLYVTVSNSTEVQMTKITSREAESSV
ncbi:PREDICTED: G-protein coupled receptor 54-like [Branchiostoma belcheri]|uniref:G-protein coupled receptor 54-like n=1 Tax=Branchiostoma belcheri TaxID=7741 RepID=A0A6P4YLX3_BRABE|nr:PREDICTED: G-protein coupled receptor 54-like [Branchiostoma belcheri]